MPLYLHLALKDANKIISLANEGWTNYAIAKYTKVSKGKIHRCLEHAKVTRIKQNLSKPWTGPHVSVHYNSDLYKDLRDARKANRAYNYASHAEIVYLPFVDFCKNLYEKKVLNVKVKRSADEYIKEFRKEHPTLPCPSR